ncbi:MAG: hypothetical protein RIG63_30175 [Coleofasciculus chthonoplastes F3-SA18-01]|uniref:hypothetical protein n=1 Tax=Coleofasciculus chthonoplastes TaxID=64178 RepID=UPI0033012E22
MQLPLLNGDSESKQTATLRQPELDLTGIRVLTVDDEPSADSGKPKRERSLG